MKKITAFGEIMMRITPKDNMLIEDTDQFETYYGGTESNTLVTLSSLGNKTTYITKIPNDSLGKGVMRHLRKHNVGLEGVILGGDSLGLYFMEQGFGQRPSKVIYHRKGSSVNTLKLAELDIDKIFENANWFHVTGISLGISEHAKELAIELVKIAKERKMIVSFDFNYRSKLWTIESAREAYKEIMPYVDVCFGNIFDLNNLLLIKEEDDNKTINKLLSMYNIKYLINTKREIINSNSHSISAHAYTKETNYQTEKYSFEILDRIGAGDAFVAGVVHVLNQDINDIDNALKFGVKCDILKHFVKGDVLSITKEEVENFKLEGQDVIR